MMDIQEKLINAGIEKLGVSREQIVNLAKAMEAVGIGSGISATTQALQAISAGGVIVWLDSFAPDSVMSLKFAPKLREYLVINKGDIILIKAPTKRNPARLMQAYVRSVTAPPGGKRRLSLVGANQRKYNIFEDHPDIVCKLDSSENKGAIFVELEKPE